MAIVMSLPSAVCCTLIIDVSTPLMSMEIREAVNEVIVGMITGRFVETFERYYHEDAVMSVDGLGEGIAKDMTGDRQSKCLDTFGAFRYAKATSVVVDGHKAAIEWDVEFTQTDGTSCGWKQVAFQTWENGKIIREILYHK